MSSPKQKCPRRELLQKLGENIRASRRERGLTQQALADALDLSVAYVSLIERGQRNPPYTTVVATAQALGVPPSRLFGEGATLGGFSRATQGRPDGGRVAGRGMVRRQ
jgi:transcriptional regulator with XRE-family HTH domain